MALYQFSKDGMFQIQRETLSQLRITERHDLQRVLRGNIDSVAPDTLVISEEFSEWEDSRRRIDLLGIDREGNLVVIELKRTDDGGHMELQAIRYAAMISTLAFDRIVSVFAAYLRSIGQDGDPEKIILDHLGWESPGDGEIAEKVRIVLVSPDFSSEITSTVLWLNEQGLDIRCVRLTPYRLDAQVLLDIQQVIPLPEAADYMVRLREKKDEERKLTGRRQQNRDLTKYSITTRKGVYSDLPKRRAIFLIVRELVDQGIHPDSIQSALPVPLKFHRAAGNLEWDDFRETVKQRSNSGGPAFNERRWFREDGDLIFARGETFVFSNQWGSRTEECMQSLISTFPDCGISFSAQNSHGEE